MEHHLSYKPHLLFLTGLLASKAIPTLISLLFLPAFSILVFIPKGNGTNRSPAATLILQKFASG